MANVLSTTGTWMQKVAQNWLVLTISGSAFYLGLDGFVGELPILLLTLVGGVIADRHDRRYLLIGSQAVQLTVRVHRWPALVYFDVVRIWHVLALSFTTGIAQAFGGPAYQSLLPSLVPQPRPAERDRAQLDPVQPVAHPRPADRRRRRSPPSAWPPASR